MSKQKCGFMKCDGCDVVCTLHNITLGDIMGYSGKTCDICTLSFFNSLSKRLAKSLCVLAKEEKLTDCDYCRNAYTCEELSPNNDLSFITLSYDTNSNTRIMLRTGDRQATVLLFEERTKYGWKPIHTLVLRNCPFCGRELVENKRYFTKGSNNND